MIKKSAIFERYMNLILATCIHAMHRARTKMEWIETKTECERVALKIAVANNRSYSLLKTVSLNLDRVFL